MDENHPNRRAGQVCATYITQLAPGGLLRIVRTPPSQLRGEGPGRRRARALPDPSTGGSRFVVKNCSRAHRFEHRGRVLNAGGLQRLVPREHGGLGLWHEVQSAQHHHRQDHLAVLCLNRSDPRPRADDARARRRLRCSRGPLSGRGRPVSPVPPPSGGPGGRPSPRTRRTRATPSAPGACLFYEERRGCKWVRTMPRKPANHVSYRPALADASRDRLP